MLEERIREIESERIIAVIRENNPEEVLPLVRSLLAGGIRVIEITLTTPDAFRLIDEIGRSDEFRTPDGQGVILGAGSVRQAEQIDQLAKSAISFAASPVTDRGTIERCRSEEIVMMSGALTPNEIVAALDMGAPVVKLFPLPPNEEGYLRSILAPLQGVRIAPSGGITSENGPALLSAGAWALNVGSWLTPSGLDREERSREVTRRAKMLRKVCADRL